MTTLGKVLVGSRLHGLHDENSDWDYRGVFKNDLVDIISPFQKTQNTSWIEGKIDDTSYELINFCLLATKGNATILKVFHSNVVIETSPSFEHMKDSWERFIDTKNIINAHRGYALNQYKKIELDPTEGLRNRKFAVAYLRVMWQLWEFLKTNEYKVYIDQGIWFDRMKSLRSTFTPKCFEWFLEIEELVEEQIKLIKDYQKPDYRFIENFLVDCYTLPE